MGYWLMKSEPDVFGIDHLKKRPKRTEPWDGVRNYQARNMLRDQMREGDLAFFYHSNCEEPGIVGIMEVVREGYPDASQFDPDAKYYDPASDPAKPRWYRVDVRYVRHLAAPRDARRAEGLCRRPLVRAAAATPRQPAVGDAGDARAVGVHPRAGRLLKRPFMLGPVTSA